MLAYASDRSGENNLDIWVQQIPDGPPVRLTRHAADEVEPSFSADGSRIAFQSSRLGGGIYVVPTLGGEERLLAARGFSPRFSPDGKWIAYGVARTRPAAESTWRQPPAVQPSPSPPASIGLSPPSGHQTADTCCSGRSASRDAPPENNVDWYVAEVPGGSPVPTDARSALLREGFQAFQGLPSPDAWVERRKPHPLSRHRRGLLEHVAGGHLSRGLARQRARRSGRRSARPTKRRPRSTSDGRMVFISRTMGADIWSLPIDANRGTRGGAAEARDAGCRR